MEQGGGRNRYVSFRRVSRHGKREPLFWIALLYSVLLMSSNMERYFYNLPANLFTADVGLGLAAMIIFGGMVVINSKWIAPMFSIETIKFCLGLGFVAY